MKEKIFGYLCFIIGLGVLLPILFINSFRFNESVMFIDNARESLVFHIFFELSMLFDTPDYRSVMFGIIMWWFSAIGIFFIAWKIRRLVRRSLIRFHERI